MIIHGTPLNTDVMKDRFGRDRFWYWHGASGRRYIHSIYALEACPRLPGATYVLVRHSGRFRAALAVGRLASWPRYANPGDPGLELHVHLMAETAAETADVLADLRQGLSEAAAGEGERIAA